MRPGEGGRERAGGKRTNKETKRIRSLIEARKEDKQRNKEDQFLNKGDVSRTERLFAPGWCVT